VAKWTAKMQAISAWARRALHGTARNFDIFARVAV
jgi:hypothetical protein